MIRILITKHSSFNNIKKEFSNFEILKDLENFSNSEINLSFVLKLALEYNLEELAM